MSIIGVELMLAVALALIHGLAAELPINRLVPMHRWTSFAGGISIAYVFLEVFPELAHAQKELSHAQLPLLNYLENHIYIAAVLGLVLFYGLDIFAERFAERVRRQQNHPSRVSHTLPFWIHLGAFTLLNIIAGYLLQGFGRHHILLCILFFMTTALHFFIIDEKLREHYRSLYDRLGRWVLVGAIMLGALLGQTIQLSSLAVAVVWSFLAGSIILNVLKRELPDSKETCFRSFIVGLVLFATLLNLKQVVPMPKSHMLKSDSPHLEQPVSVRSSQSHH